MSDARVQRGVAKMLELRRDLLAAGARPLGWKVGFGSPAAFEKLGIDRPLVGFLTDRSLLADGAGAHVGDWAAPMLEAEIAAYVGEDGTIAALGAAIELADVDPPPADPEAILGGNIFHRHVLLGPRDDGRTDAAGVTARLLRDGEPVDDTDTPQALTGEVADVVGLTAAVLEAAGERLRPGEVIITGSIFPPMPVQPGQTVVAELGPLGSLTVVIET